MIHFLPDLLVIDQLASSTTLSSNRLDPALPRSTPMIEYQTHVHEYDNTIELLHRCSVHYPLSIIYSSVLPNGRSSLPHVVVQILLSIYDDDIDVDDSDDDSVEMPIIVR